MDFKEGAKTPSQFDVRKEADLDELLTTVYETLNSASCLKPFSGPVLGLLLSRKPGFYVDDQTKKLISSGVEPLYPLEERLLVSVMGLDHDYRGRLREATNPVTILEEVKEGNWLRSWAKKRIEENQRWLRSTRKLIVGCSSVESKGFCMSLIVVIHIKFDLVGVVEEELSCVKKSDQVEHCVVFCGHGHDVCVTQLSGASGHEKAVCVIEWSIGHEGNDMFLFCCGPKVENDSIIWAHRIKGKAELSWQSFRRQDTLGLVGAAGHNKSKPKTDQGSLPAKPIGERAKQLKALRSLRTKDGACKVDRAPVV
ncbi:hypothetical protein YC2023_005033 [Brassica napus]